MKLNNTYYILRHGEALSNEKNINSSWPEQFRNPLTSNGTHQIKRAARQLQQMKIDMIFSSDLLRAKETAEIVGKVVGIKPEYDTRLREIDFGLLNGKPIEELLYLSFAKKIKEKKSETYQNVLRRVKKCFNEIDKKYKDKHILVVSHQCPMWVLETAVHGLTLKEALKIPKRKRIQRGELRKLA